MFTSLELINGSYSCSLLLIFYISDQHGFTPLHYACSHGHVNIVDYLLNKGARNDIVNMGGDSILHLAVSHGKYDVVLRVSKSIVVSTIISGIIYL